MARMIESIAQCRAEKKRAGDWINMREDEIKMLTDFYQKKSTAGACGGKQSAAVEKSVGQNALTSAQDGGGDGP